MQRHPRREKLITRQLYEAIGQARSRHDRDQLTAHDDLEAIATNYANTLNFRGERGHDVGSTLGERAAQFSAVRENLAYRTVHGYNPEQTASGIVGSWMDSHGHRDNLLHPQPDLHGVGLSLSGDSLIVCHLFAGGQYVDLSGRVRAFASRLFGN